VYGVQICDVLLCDVTNNIIAEDLLRRMCDLSCLLAKIHIGKTT
jgi:hypothetical protein